ncbi:hypothetical protein HAX54_038494, partial [Datura stramonium]|nr:hypothetical protein [Datura stramonium]
MSICGETNLEHSKRDQTKIRKVLWSKLVKIDDFGGVTGFGGPLQRDRGDGRSPAITDRGLTTRSTIVASDGHSGPAAADDRNQKVGLSGIYGVIPHYFQSMKVQGLK